MNRHKILGLPLLFWVRQGLRRYQVAAKNYQCYQQQALQQALQVVAGSDLARYYGLFPGQRSGPFQAEVPILNYQDLEPYIVRTMQGDFGAMFAPEHPPVYFATTSGTTGPTKYIPVTRMSQSQYQKSWILWGMALSQYDHEFLFQKILNLTGSTREWEAQCGVPVGSITGLLAQNLSPWLRHAYVLKPEVGCLQDQDQRYQLIVRLALLCGNLHMINTANPSTLLPFYNYLQQDGERHIREIADGRLQGMDQLIGKVPAPVLAPALKARRGLARTLERILADHGALKPQLIWPRLNMIGVWTGGSLGAYLPAVRAAFGDQVLLRDHGLCASEGRITTPLTFGGRGGVLNFQDNFYEFVPVDSPGDILTADQLEIGCSYKVLLTNCAGLIRYDMNDVVRCEGFWHGVPQLSFQHKGSHIASITGEKLTATQVAQSLQKVFQDQVPSPPSEFTLVPQFGPEGRYQLCLEQGQLSDQSMVAVARHLDRELMAANREYLSKRKSGRLGPVEPTPVPPGVFERFRAHRLQKGSGVVEQYKQPVLLAAPDDVADWKQVCDHAES